MISKETAVQAIIDEIYNEIDRLYYESRSVYERWMTLMARREVDRKNRRLEHDERTNYELKLEFKENSFSVRWLSVMFIRNQKTGRSQKIYKSVAVPVNGSYGRTKFPKASEWELEVILHAEEVLGPIRNQIKHLMKAHQSIIYACKSGHVNIEIKPLVTRVEKTELTIASIKERLI